MPLNKQEVANINDLFSQIDKLKVQVETLTTLQCEKCRCDEVLSAVSDLKEAVNDFASRSCSKK